MQPPQRKNEQPNKLSVNHHNIISQITNITLACDHTKIHHHKQQHNNCYTTQQLLLNSTQLHSTTLQKMSCFELCAQVLSIRRQDAKECCEDELKNIQCLSEALKGCAKVCSSVVLLL